MGSNHITAYLIARLSNLSHLDALARWALYEPCIQPTDQPSIQSLNVFYASDPSLINF